MKTSLRLHRLLTWFDRSATLWLERVKLHEQLFAIVVAVVIGVLGGYAAVGFRGLISGLTQVFWQAPELTQAVVEAAPAWRRLLIPVLGGVLVAPIVMRWVKEAQGYGAPEVMEAVALHKGVIRPRVILGKMMASALTLASGGSAGREGPIIHIGSAIGSAVGRLASVPTAKMRTFVACGASAGIAATFNAPIAGALFSVETILAEVGFARFSPIVIASVTATVISRHYLGDAPVFAVPDYELGSSWELMLVMVLGVVCALSGYAFMRVLGWVEDALTWRERLPALARPAVGGALLAGVAWWAPQVLGHGGESINQALNGELTGWLLLGLVAAKMVATACTVGSGGSGGVFAPSLFIGAMIGGAFGSLCALAFGGSAIEAGGYALVGMGGVVAATTRAPITAIVIIFEITSSYQIILPLMLVCIISTVVHTRISRETIYTMKLARRGVELFRGRSLDLLKGHTVGQALHTDVATVPRYQTLAPLLERVLDSDETHYYVCDDQEQFVGVILLTNLRKVFINREGLENVLLAEDVTDEGIQTCAPEESLSEAMIRFERSGLAELPVVDPVSGALLGALRYQDVVAVYNNAMLMEESAEGMASRIATGQSGQRVSLVAGYHLAEWEPPQRFWDQPFSELALPRTYHVQVMLLKRRASVGGPVEVIFPDAATRITPQDSLLIYGKTEDVDRVLRL